MGILSRWKEVYITYNYNDFIQCRNLLEQNNADYKSKVKSDSRHLSLVSRERCSEFSANSRIGRNDCYAIYVKKDDYQLAKNILNII